MTRRRRNSVRGDPIKHIRDRLPSLKKEIAEIEKDRKWKWERSRLMAMKMQVAGWEKLLEKEEEKDE